MSIDLDKCVFPPGKGERIRMEGQIAGSVRLLSDPSNAEDTGLSSMIQELLPGSSVPLHFHSKAEQLIYVLKGTGVAQIASRKFDIVEGTFFRIPRGLNHSIANTGGSTLSFLEITSPPGFERSFRKLGTLKKPKLSEVIQVCADHDTHIC